MILAILLVLVTRHSLATEAHDEQAFHKNHIAVFAGFTHAEGENEPTVGLDYERRLNEHFGIGGLIDHAGGELDSTIVAPALFFHAGPWTSLVALGNEHTEEGDEAVLRLGVSYELEVGDWTVAPGFNLDMVDNEAPKEVYGVSIGRGF